MSNYEVAMEAAWLVRDVKETDDAIGVAVSEAGKRLNETDKQYVEVEPGVTGCPACGEPFDAAFLAANTALVGLLLEIDIFNADSEEHAERIAKSEVGGALRDVPLEIIEVIETDGGRGRRPRRRVGFRERCDDATDSTVVAISVAAETFSNNP